MITNKDDIQTDHLNNETFSNMNPVSNETRKKLKARITAGRRYYLDNASGKNDSEFDNWYLTVANGVVSRDPTHNIFLCNIASQCYLKSVVYTHRSHMLLTLVNGTFGYNLEERKELESKLKKMFIEYRALVDAVEGKESQQFSFTISDQKYISSIGNNAITIRFDSNDVAFYKNKFNFYTVQIHQYNERINALPKPPKKVKPNSISPISKSPADPKQHQTLAAQKKQQNTTQVVEKALPSQTQQPPLYPALAHVILTPNQPFTQNNEAPPFSQFNEAPPLNLFNELPPLNEFIPDLPTNLFTLSTEDIQSYPILPLPPMVTDDYLDTIVTEDNPAILNNYLLHLYQGNNNNAELNMGMTTDSTDDLFNLNELPNVSSILNKK